MNAVILARSPEKHRKSLTSRQHRRTLLLVRLDSGSHIMAAPSSIASTCRTRGAHCHEIKQTFVNTAASNGRHARCYLRARRQGALSTLSQRIVGYPYGSVVPFVLDQQARPIILVSRLAEHTRNLQADARASLLVRDDGDDVQAGARLTLLGDAARIECDPALKDRFLRYQPRSRQLLDLGDFSFLRITPVTLRYIAGFGTIRWVSASEYAPPANELAHDEPRIVAQTNAGESDSLRICCSQSLRRGVIQALMLGVDCDGFDVVANGVNLRYDFPEPATDSESVRRAVAETLKIGRDTPTP